MTATQNIIEIMNVHRTLRPNSFSPNRHAILHFTILFDMTAMRIDVAAIKSPIDPSCAFVAISCVIASTSANQDTTAKR